MQNVICQSVCLQIFTVGMRHFVIYLQAAIRVLNYRVRLMQNAGPDYWVRVRVSLG